MNKKQLLAIGLISLGTLAFISKNKETYSEEELEKINRYKKYLNDKNFVIVSKKDYDKISKNSKKLFSISSIPSYYSIARSVARYVL
ncbi:hypothetical protein [Gemelliphila palaticanis]|uniref:Uncharacterized protein n=1 Tax=Gemelliphila palaticanis TaxID=81950 RepID=A0ABX2SYU9_9BACL|nr:hypothetical protein [Gemella palaticanis]MBF0715267.1 hypothetical protein [Gemella palaticanis]NYS47197.1 hypothetical protein [Gemella palaticanis]